MLPELRGIPQASQFPDYILLARRYINTIAFFQS